MKKREECQAYTYLRYSVLEVPQRITQISVSLTLLSLFALPAAAGLLTGQGVVVLDATGAQRAAFSTNETIGFKQLVNNGAASPNRIVFQFVVVAPNQNTVFRHVGNSVRGTVGNAASQISGVPVSGFAQGPGIYTLTATAQLDGITLSQTQTFTISSPNILLIYPPNGSQNLSDNPLTFQWYSSGASSYRVTVGDNAALYNALFVQTTGPGANSLTYPQNPADPRQRLSTGQTYWWKVEGLDSNGNVIAQAQVPFSFSVAGTALTRDLAVTRLEITGPPDIAGNIPFLVTVVNQGNTTETNTPLRVTLGGLTAPGSPLPVPQISPADVLTFPVSASIPTGQTSSLAIACLTIFDDNVSNNCKTLAVSRATAISSATFAAQSPELTGAQIWQAIVQILKDRGINLDDYNFTSMEGSLTREELASLLDQLRQGQAQANLSGPLLPGSPVFTPAPKAKKLPDETASAPPPLDDTEEELTGAQILRAIAHILRDRGINLDDYTLRKMEGSMTREELAAFLDQLLQGQAQVNLSGPPLSGSATFTLAPTAKKPSDGTALAPPLPRDEPQEQPKTVVQEKTWSGVTPPLSARTVSLTLTNEYNWKRLWQRVSDEPVPLVDFKEHMILAFIVGGQDSADRVSVEDCRSFASLLTVRYRLITYVRPFGRPPTESGSGDSSSPYGSVAAPRKTVPYLLVAIPRTRLKVQFERLTEDANE